MFQLRDGAIVVPSTASYDDASRSATLTPTAPLARNRRYTASVQASDLLGNPMAQPLTWSFTTAVDPGATPATLWDTARVPAVTAANDPSAVELGVRFTAAQSGVITGVRFYKGAGNIGPHVGRLWTGDGALLASAAFTNETLSGWQETRFSSPVAITAGQPYVASYHAPAGRYSVTAAGFNGAGVVSPPLTAPATAAGAGNGLYQYGSGSFPAQTHNGNDYAVDVIFEVDAGPQVVATSPTAGATNQLPSTAVTATFSEPVQPGSVGLELRDSTGALTSGTQTYDAATRTARLTPASPLLAGRTYTASVTGALDEQGSALPGPVVWSFVVDVGPAVVATSPAAGATNVAVGSAITATFSEPVLPASVGLELRDQGGALTAGTKTYDAATRTARLAPTSALLRGRNYTASVTGAVDEQGIALAAPVVWSFAHRAAAAREHLACHRHAADGERVQHGCHRGRARGSAPTSQARSSACVSTRATSTPGPTSASSGPPVGSCWHRSPSPERPPVAGSMRPSRPR